MRMAPKSLGQAMYVASKLDESWLQNVQRKLYVRSRDNPGYVFSKLWGLITDPRNLRRAFVRVARNKGRRTAGIDGVTVGQILNRGMQAFLDSVRAELRQGTYRPNPVRRVFIPKQGQPGKFRPLGIPTVKDRVVQAAMKNILEPIFEADFYPVSHGFRPRRSVHGAIQQINELLTATKPGGTSPYQWAIEGDIKGCFDNIDHHEVMNQVRRRIDDGKVNRLIVTFLKAGILSEGQFFRTDVGTPQGGILSPLLANIALSAIEERYERHAWPRHKPKLMTKREQIEERVKRYRTADRKAGRVVLVPARYADDFIVFVGMQPGPQCESAAENAANEEKTALATFLRDKLKLELSETKTLVTPVTRPIRFLGHLLSVRYHRFKERMVGQAVVPKDRSHLLRERIKDLFRRRTTQADLASRLRMLNRILRGWSQFYRHAYGAKRVFRSLDHYVWWTIYRWLRKKHEGLGAKKIVERYAWREPGYRSIHWKDGEEMPFRMATVRVHRFQSRSRGSRALHGNLWKALCISKGARRVWK
jgi:RNA-directed DNA polymerase